MGEAALTQLELTPNYHGGRTGPLFAWDLCPCCFLEQKSHWCHQWNLLLATPILADLWPIHGTTNEPLILSASKTFHLLTPVGDDQTMANPKRASWDDSTAPMARRALPCRQSVEGPSPRKGTGCWMQSRLIYHLHLLRPHLCIPTSLTLCRAVLCRQSRTT